MNQIDLSALTFWGLVKLTIAIEWEIFTRWWPLWVCLGIISALLIFIGYVLSAISPARR